MATDERRWRRVQRVIGVTVGAALCVAAIVVAARGVDWSVLRQVSPWQAAALAAGVLGNLIVTAAMFWIVTRSFDAQPTVSFGRMTALIGVSALLNYLPLPRPGMVGRTAYLKLKHELPVRQSVMILAVIFASSVAVLGATAVALMAVPGAARWLVAAAALVAISMCTGPIARRVLRRPVVAGWTWMPLRALDMAISAFRVWIAFGIVGVELGYAEAIITGAAALLVRMAGLTPNGLGLSEWVVAALSAALAPVSTATGAAAALIDRAMEVVVISVAGALSAWRFKRAG